MEILKEKPNSLAIASLVTGIISILPLLGILFGITAFICGIVDLVKIKNGKSKVKGMGFDIAGIVMGLISIVLFFLLYIQIILLIFNR